MFVLCWLLREFRLVCQPVPKVREKKNKHLRFEVELICDHDCIAVPSSSSFSSSSSCCWLLVILAQNNQLLFKGWFCGNIKIIHNENVMDGRSLSSIQGLPITREWIHRAAQIIHEDEEEKEEEEGETMRRRRKEQGIEEQSQQHRLPRHRTTTKENNDDKSIDANTSSQGDGDEEPSAAVSFHPHPEACFSISSDAEFILVIEKEGVYTRLSEDRFYDRIPCILITGKGFPDVATRAMVFCLSRLLNVPVMGLADCNPYGVAVLQSYFRGGRGNGGESNMERFSVPIQWMGLRPSQLIQGLDVRAECADLTTGGESGVLEEVEHNLPFQKLPKEVFQKLSDMDMKKLKSLLDETNEFVHLNESRRMELELMKQNGWKVELESLHWLGMDFMSDWLEDILLTNKERMAQKKLAKRFRLNILNKSI
jgi:hypothetical protein